MTTHRWVLTLFGGWVAMLIPKRISFGVSKRLAIASVSSMRLKSESWNITRATETGLAIQRIPTAPDLDTFFFRLRTPALQFRRVRRSAPAIIGIQVIKLNIDTISLLSDQITSNDWEHVWPRAWARIARRWIPFMKHHGGDPRDLVYGIPIISRRQPVPWRLGVIERNPNAREQPYLLWSLLRQRIRQMHQNANCYDSGSSEGTRFLYLLSLSRTHQPRPVHQVWSTEPVQLSLWQQQEPS